MTPPSEDDPAHGRAAPAGALFDIGRWPACPVPFNLAAHVLAPAQARPEAIALEILGGAARRQFSFAEIEARVRRMAGGLLALGLAPGDRVLLRLGNSEAFPVAFLGAIAAGLVAVPSSTQLTTLEITALAARLRPALILAEPGIALPDPAPCKVLGPAGMAALSDHAPASYAMGDPERPAFVIFTSGTSALPQAVCHAHRAVWARGMMHEGWYGLRATDRVLHAGAFNWTYTLGTGLMDPWSVGATALIPAAGTRPADLPPLLAEGGATLFAAVPGVYRQMLRADLPPLPALRHGLSAGEKMAPEIHRAWHAATGLAIHEAFGMSECSTFISSAPGRPVPPDRVGRPQPGRRVAILRSDGRVAAHDEPGVIAVAADDPGLMLGYDNAPEASAARLSPCGTWFMTGDQGAMDADGAIAYLGRDDDMINAGGYRVSPLEVEAALEAHPDLREVAAVELPLGAGRSILAAVCVTSAPVSETALDAFAAARLARYKLPRRYIFVEAVPRSANGKLLRRVLRETYGAPDDKP